MIPVILTHQEELVAAVMGLKRTATSHAASPLTYSARKNVFEDIEINSEAAAAEMAVARLLGFTDFIPTCGTFKEQADVGKGIEVKHTRWKDGHMIVTSRDRDDDIAVLVTGLAPHLYIAGWIPIKDARSKRYIRDKGTKNESFWITIGELFPFDDLASSSYAATHI